MLAAGRRVLVVLALGAALLAPRAGVAQVRAAMSAAAAPVASLRALRENGALVLELGPVDVPAAAGEDAMESPPPLTVAVPVDGWLRGYDVELVDAAGRRVPHELLHHVNVIAPQRRELFSAIMLRVAAAGSETAPVTLPWFVGYRVHRGDSLLVTAMLHNPTGTSYRGVRLRVRFPVRDGASWLGAVSVFPFYLDVMPPAGGHSFDLPPGRSERYWEGSPAIPGRILGVGGHLHQYGVLLRLEDRTAGKVLWEGKPTVDSTGEVVAMGQTKFVWRLGLSVYPDHVYRLTAFYDNPTGTTIVDGGMGALGGAFLPARGAVWPGVTRTAPDYLTDLRVTYRLGPQAMTMKM